MEKDQAFLEYVVKALVDHPNDVKLDRKVDEMGVLLTLSVNGEDKANKKIAESILKEIRTGLAKNGGSVVADSGSESESSE
jgi:predicted RNA-binding protein YlqC (UPF0109 family)